ncbi:hypothetical protein ACWJJH_00070 [Endozoicomonadaceae bacterium StTr2]
MLLIRQKTSPGNKYLEVIDIHSHYKESQPEAKQALSNARYRNLTTLPLTISNPLVSVLPVSSTTPSFNMCLKSQDLTKQANFSGFMFKQVKNAGSNWTKASFSLEIKF